MGVEVITSYAFNLPRVLRQLYLCKAGKKKGCKPEPLQEEPDGVHRKCGLRGLNGYAGSAYIWGQATRNGDHAGGTWEATRLRPAGSRWQHSRPHPGREGRALPPLPWRRVFAPGSSSCCLWAGRGQCRLGLGSQLQAVHGISILSAPSGLTGTLCFEAAESRERA